MIDTKVINFIGGPGVGKSTTASDLFAFMKRKGINCELVPEYAKGATWREAPSILKDQLYVFAKQHNAQFRLIGKVQYMITDSPLILSLHYGERESEEFKKLVRVKWNEFNNINFYINRTKMYNPIGRNQNEEEADEISRNIMNILNNEQIDYTPIDSDSVVQDIYNHERYLIARSCLLYSRNDQEVIIMDENHLCPTCKFYRKKEKPSNTLIGFCHRYPRCYSNGYYNIIEVKEVDWCGEWIANEDYIRSNGEST